VGVGVGVGVDVGVDVGVGVGVGVGVSVGVGGCWREGHFMRKPSRIWYGARALATCSEIEIGEKQPGERGWGRRVGGGVGQGSARTFMICFSMP
jgi:hypothetical protein